ncbi:hypothetical protein ABZ345_32015 [Lentzea sp. NPDC005914]
MDVRVNFELSEELERVGVKAVLRVDEHGLEGAAATGWWSR